MAEDGKVIFKYVGDTSGIDTANSEAESKVKSGSDKLTSTIKSAATIGAIVGVVKEVVDLGASFETSMAKASTLFGDVQVDTEALNDKILELSSSSGVAADELGDSLYNALSASIPVTEDMNDALGFLEKSTRLAKSGFTDVDTAMSATVKTLNAYGLGVEETDRVQKILMQTQNKGITTVDELGGVLAQVTPTAAAMGVEFEQVGAALATMTAQGTPTAQATTQLNSLFAELGKNGTEAAKNLEAAAEGTEYAGMSFQDMMAAGIPLNDVLDLMGTYAANNGLGMLDMFSSIEAGKAALSTAGENSATFADNLDAMSTETDVVGEAFDKVTGTSAEKFNKILNELKNVAIDLFTALSPLLDALMPLINALLPIIQVLAEAIGDTITALMPLIEMFAEGIGEAISGVMPFIEGLLAILGGLINFVVGVFTGDWEKAWGGILSIFKGVMNLIPTILETVINGALKIVNGLIDGINLITGIFGITAIPTIKDVKLPRFKTGLDFVPNDYFLNYADYGEAILSKEDASLWRGIGGASGIESALSKDSGTSSVNNSSSTVINSLTVNPNSADYARMLALLEKSDGARQKERAGG